MPRHGLLFVALTSAALAVACSDDAAFTEGTYEAAEPTEPRFPDTGAADAGGDGRGALVLGAWAESDGTRSAVLAVLDPRTGREIASREPMVVSAVQYDGLRDLFYVFESETPDPLPGPSEGSVLHVRSYDRSHMAWTEHARMRVPALQSADAVVSLRERLAYVAYADASTGTRLVTYDTSNPASPKALPDVPLEAAPVGAMGFPGAEGAGGNVLLLHHDTDGCEGTCPVALVPVQVPAVGAPIAGAPTPIGAAPPSAVPSFAALVLRERALIAFPPATGDATATLAVFDSVTLVPDAPPPRPRLGGARLRPAAVAECANVALLLGPPEDPGLLAIPLAPDGRASRLSMGHAGQSVHFDPATGSVLVTTRRKDGPALAAFTLDRTSSAPRLRRRSAPWWSPPGDLQPEVVAVRAPRPIACAPR